MGKFLNNLAQFKLAKLSQDKKVAAIEQENLKDLLGSFDEGASNYIRSKMDPLDPSYQHSSQRNIEYENYRMNQFDQDVDTDR